jgi:hypothetical protein
MPAPGVTYPVGEFTINKTRVIYVRAGVSLLAVAGQYDIPLARLLEFNDMQEEDVLVKGQLIFLQRKRRTGANEYHVMRGGENLYDVCQSEGIRIYLQGSAPTRPRVLTGAGGQGGPDAGTVRNQQ